jgi:hypothetical protein
MQTFTLIDLINTAVGLMSLALGGFALWLAWDIYSRAKESEKEAAITLEAIKTQTDSLQKLNGRLLDRLTRYATSPRPVDEGIQMLITTIATLPATLLNHMGTQTGTTASATQPDEAAMTDLVACYIMLYYYSGLTNAAAQSTLPTKEMFETSPSEYAAIKRLVDMSASDFIYMKNIVNKVHPSRITASIYHPSYIEAENNLATIVHDTDTHYRTI